MALRTVAALLLITACQSTPPPPSVAPVPPPAWVGRGTCAVNEAGASKLYGVGVVTNVKNAAVRLSTGRTRARGEIGRLVERVSAAMAKSFAMTTTVAAANDEDQFVEGTIRTHSAEFMEQVTEVDTWTDPASGALYTLSELDLTKLVADERFMDSWPAGLRERWRTELERVVAEVEATSVQERAARPTAAAGPD